jgi:chaperone required for assembly of F1-ATPase
MTFQEKRSMMLTVVEQWQQSGMTQAEFAQEHNLTLVKLRYWIHKHRQIENGSAFIQLNGFSHAGISIRYPNGVELSLPTQTPAVVLKSLINF